MNNTEYKALTIGDWIITLILLAIPLVNIIMLIVWAASSVTHPSKKSFAQATLIVYGVIFGIAILAGVLIALLTHATK